MRALEFDNPVLKGTFDEYFFHLKELEEKIGRMNEKIEEIALRDSYREPVAKLKCLKGIETLTALSMVVEVGDFRRFTKAEEFMSFLGLVPSENSSGDKRRQGGITKAGTSHLRRLLVEAGITDSTGEWASAWWCGEEDRLFVLCRMRTRQANG